MFLDYVLSALRNNDGRATSSIDLDWKGIDAEGAALLADALEGNSTVTSIDLRFNNRIDEGAAKLAAALKVNNTVTSIRISEIGMSICAGAQGGLARLKKACAWNTRHAAWLRACACVELRQHLSEAGLVKIIFGYCDLPYGLEQPKLEEKLELY